MSDSRKQSFYPYIRRMADLFRLRDWEIAVDDDPPAGTAIASVWVANSAPMARVRLSEAFLADGPEGQRATIVHELLHVRFAEMAHTVTREIDPVTCRCYDVEFERSIESLTLAIAPHYPLPGKGVRPMPSKEKKPAAATPPKAEAPAKAAPKSAPKGDAKPASKGQPKKS